MWTTKSFKKDLDEKFVSSVSDPGAAPEVARRYEREFWEAMDKLGVTRPDTVLRVSEYMYDIIEFVSRLLETRMAYVSGDGSVYFDTEAYVAEGRFEYGTSFTGRCSDDIAASAPRNTTTNDGSHKKTPRDFALWKAYRPEDGSFVWETPWGRGRPGWHVECSAMARAAYGDHLDVHSGGVDLRFPHHENEIAQTNAHNACCRTCPRNGNTQYRWVDHFIHTGHLEIDGCKMSKSLKNFVTVDAGLRSGLFTARQLRILFLLHPWQSPMKFCSASVEEAKSREASLVNFCHKVRSERALRKNEHGGTMSMGMSTKEDQADLMATRDKVHARLCDNIDTKGVMDVLSTLVRRANARMQNATDIADEKCDPPPLDYLEGCRDIVTTTLETFGVEISDERHQQGTDTTVSLVDILAHFRNRLRLQAAEYRKMHKRGEQALSPLRVCDDLFRLTDKIREKVSVAGGVHLQDRNGFSG
jgi:cysteinyl-tRNA synthetase